MTLDLTGLPPSPAEIDAFVDERTRAGGDRAALDAAYERVVDRLLASPHFGERWAVPWLDLARYADSNGYEKDAARSIWRYRDWVVDALNADMPFDRFTLEQLAGDLLPGATVAQRIATGFHRNTMFNEEGGVDPEEARFERMCDRAATTATVWLGTTLGCARCHDHKHDPFSQRDFYGLLAFFDGAREETLPLPTPAQARRLDEIRAARAPLAQALATWTPALGEAQRRWERELLALPARFPALAIESPASSTGAPLVAQRLIGVGVRSQAGMLTARRPPSRRRRSRRCRPIGRIDGARARDRRAAGSAARCAAAGRRAGAWPRRRVLPDRHRRRGGARRRSGRRAGSRSRSRA